MPKMQTTAINIQSQQELFCPQDKNNNNNILWHTDANTYCKIPI